ncbi:MAG: hypothetical protein GXP54_03500 [Deltaproteobacteria bacterium]|nr:hypothetical protein [Deltaproteobacteria bacterium]
MNQAVSADLSPTNQMVLLARDLFEFVSGLQHPRISDSEWAREALEKCGELRLRVAQAKEAMASRRHRLAVSLEEVANNLREYSRELSESPRVARLRELNVRLSYNYEELLAHLRRLKVRSLEMTGGLDHIKPRNWDRNVVHVGLGLFGVLMYELVLNRGQALWVLLALVLAFFMIEVTRRIWPDWNRVLVERVFGRISRPRELKGVTSSSWYLLALLLMVFLVPQPAAELGALVLAFGDPAASIVGKRFGRRKLLGSKTAAGTFAFMAVAFVVAVSFLFMSPHGLAVLPRLSLAATVAIAGAITELASDRWDDNFTIPVMCSSIAYFWF